MRLNRPPPIHEEAVQTSVKRLTGNKGEPRMDTKTDERLLVRIRHGMKPTRERGRPARTRLGTASANSSTPAGRVDGWVIAGKLSGMQRVACGRDARAPGWACS